MYLGVASMAAVAIIFLYFPINTLLAKKYGDLQVRYFSELHVILLEIYSQLYIGISGKNSNSLQ